MTGALTIWRQKWECSPEVGLCLDLACPGQICCSDEIWVVVEFWPNVMPLVPSVRGHSESWFPPSAISCTGEALVYFFSYFICSKMIKSPLKT